MLFVLFIISRYATPSAQLLEMCIIWLLRKREDRTTSRFVEGTLINFKRKKHAESTGQLLINWPPSLAEIEGADKNKII